jgi:DNA polymerase-1
MSNAPADQLKPGDHVFLVDGSSFVFRAYFQSINQDAKYNYRSDGLPTGALRLFSTKIFQFIKDGAAGLKPTHLAIIFDKTEQTFRKDIYADYKANRREPPDDLVPQFPLMREAVMAFGLTPIEKEGFEADDIIATFAKEAEAAGADVLIVSADKDLMQLVNDKVQFYDFESGAKGKSGYRPERRIDRAGVIDYFGVPPEKVVDVQALVGDTSDNVPGVPGIGIKTASQLIGEYGDLDNLLANAPSIKQPKRRELLTNYADQARMSRDLVTLRCDVDVDTPLAATRMGELDGKRLLAFFKAMEFNTLTKRASEATGVEVEYVEPDPRLAAPVRGAKPAEAPAAATDAGFHAPPPIGKYNGGAAPGSGAVAEADSLPAHVAQAAARAAIDRKIDLKSYETISDMKALDRWIVEAADGGLVAIDAETSSADPMQSELIGISLATDAGKAGYLPLGHKNGNADLLGGGLAEGQIPIRDALARLKPMLEDPAVLKIAQNVKHDTVLFARYGIAVTPYDDPMLISYTLDANKGGSGMDDLSERWLGHMPLTFKDVAGSGRAAVGFEQVTLDRATQYAAEDADIAFRLWQVLKPRLVAEHMTTVYETLERPMVPVLARMEARGVKVDRQILSRLSGEFSQKLAGLEAEIYELAGESFNIGSPKQLGDILFGKFNLPGGKKTRTGAWSTGADVLEELMLEGNQLAARILDWRQLSKLKSTYTDLLPEFIHPTTGRVHTSYALASTTTGRLSSSEPNLQNIPVRTEEGRRIRSAFIADKGMKLISADYSQIELRLLAHVADIPALRQAFADGLDIHAMTASEMFNVPIKDMPGEVRRRAKAINFGIIYGISAFGLSNQLGIPREEAGAYIKRYFERFPGIRDYMDAMKTKVRKDGHVSTIFGRKIHFPGVNSKNPSERAFVDRASINAPLQGSAADIIRRAMIRMEDALAKAKLSARMLLQVHDELIFEAPDDEVEATLPVVKKVMEAAPEPAVKLSIPLQVDARAAQNWDEAH